MKNNHNLNIGALKLITANKVKKLHESKTLYGLVLQGYAGNLEEWVDFFNDLFLEEGIISNGERYQPEDCYTFEYDGLQNIIFPFISRVEIDIANIVVWRLKTRYTFYGMWVEDYIANEIDKKTLFDYLEEFDD